MPSPVTMPPLVFWRKTLPAPPVAMIDRLRLDQPESAGSNLDGQHALATTVLDDQLAAKVFVETLDRWILDRRLKQGMQHVKTGLVGREPGPLDLHTAERAYVHMAVVLAAPWASPMLELHHLLGAMGDKIVDGVLLAKPIAAANRVVEMVLQAVVRLHHAGGSAFGGNGVAAHRIDLRDQRHGQRWIGFRHGNGRSQSRAPRANDRDVRLEHIHRSTPPVASGTKGTHPLPRFPRRLRDFLPALHGTL